MHHHISRLMKTITLGAILMAALFSGLQPARAEAPPIPSYPPPMIVGEVFQFVEGAWAEYEILDKAQKITYTLRMSVLEAESVRRTWFSRKRPHRWMEFDVNLPDQPRVIVKHLARETPEGPGKPHEIIIQIEGHENPIRLGRMWLRKNQEEIVDATYTWSDKRLDERKITHGDRTFAAWRVQAEAEDGTTVEAIVSDQLPPFGLYFAETPEQRMQIRDWGMGARSSITGEPLGLSRWIVRQLQAGTQD